jgi:ketosteroid isomerase-like protein
MREKDVREGKQSEGVRLVMRFNDALNAGDVDGMMSLMTGDCVFENTYPAPDGECYQGQAAVRAFWEDFFRSSSRPHFEIEEIFSAGKRVVMRWVYRWQAGEGRPGSIRGVDLYRLQDGLIAEKLSYVKG